MSPTYENTHSRRYPSTSRPLPSFLMGSQTALQVELVQTWLHHLLQPLTFLVADAFVLSQLLFCFSKHFRAPKSPEAPISSPALPSYAILCNTQHSHSIFPPGQPHIQFPAPLLPGSWGYTGTLLQLYQAPRQTTVNITSLQTSYSILHLLPKLGLTTLPGTKTISSFLNKS